MARIKKLAVNLGVLVSAIAILIVFLEVGLAALKINTKSYDRFIAGKGTTYIPNAYYRHTKEGFSEGFINSHGFRDYERSWEKAANTFRILVFGDSYVEALQVALDKAFPALLEEMLNEGSSKRIEVLSLGQSGFGTADAYMRYQNFGVKYSPDLVILAFHTGNDFQNNSKHLNRETLAFYFVFSKNGDLVLDRSVIDTYGRSLTFSKQLWQEIKQRSYLANLISRRLYLLKRQIRERHFEAQFAGVGWEREEKKLDEFSDLNIFVPHLSQPWKEAFDITKGLIVKFRDTVESHGAKFVLVTLSTPEQVHPDIQQQVNKTYRLPFDYEQPDRILEEFARKEGINFLKLMPVLRDYHLETGRYLHGFFKTGTGHWNEDGHWMAAKEILRFLYEEKLVPPKSGV